MRKSWAASIIAICTIVISSNPSLAQTSGWSSPVQLSDTGRFSWFPDIAADPSGRVHVVWATFIPGYDAVMYTTADSDGIWTRPTDILALPANGAATRPTLIFDAGGIAHIVGRNDNVMTYNRIPFSDLGRPSLWPDGREMSQFGGAYFSGLALGPDGTLHFIITENSHAEECETCYQLYYRQSRDGGETWSAHLLISPIENGVIKPQILVSKKGGVHVIWDAGRGGGLAQVDGNTQVSYISSQDGGKTWSEPIRFSGASAGFPGGSGRFITIGEDGAGKLVAVWLKLPDDAPQYQVSADGGLTWSAPTPLPNVFGAWEANQSRLDTYSMATDSNGDIHLVMVGRLDSASRTPSLLHLVWNGASWSAPELIFSSDTLTPVWPRIAVGLGNQLHVAWFATSDIFGSEREGTDYRIWYSRGAASAPAIQPMIYPTPTLPPLPTTARSPLDYLPTPSPVSVEPIAVTKYTLRTEVDDYALIALSVAPILLLVGVAWVAVRSRRG